METHHAKHLQQTGERMKSKNISMSRIFSLSHFFPLASFVHRVSAASDYSWDNIDVSFIVSTGRTGTQFLANLFSAAFDKVDARHEPGPDMFRIGTAYARSEISFKNARAALLLRRCSICREVKKHGYDYYIESNSNLAYLVPVLWSVFPSAKVVHIVRDGRDCVRSWYGKKVVSPGSKTKDGLFLSETDRRRRLSAADLPDDQYHDAWRGMSRFERLCWYWRTKDSFIIDAISGDERAITVKFEDIFDSDEGFKGMWEIVRFLSLKDRLVVSPESLTDMMTHKANWTAEYRLPAWRSWPADKMNQFYRIAGEQLALYGYDKQDQECSLEYSKTNACARLQRSTL